MTEANEQAETPRDELEEARLAGELVDPDGPWDDDDGDFDGEDDGVVGGGGLSGPINWWALSPSAQATVLAGLSVWVARLVRTFQIEWTEIPPWWYQHEAFIHELLALRQAREQVAYDPTEAESAPLTWLHNLSQTRQRLRALRDSLGGDYHKCPEPRTPKWAMTSGEECQKWQLEVEAFAMNLSRQGDS